MQNVTIEILFNDREYGNHNEKGIDNPLSTLSNSKMPNKKLSNTKIDKYDSTT